MTREADVVRSLVEMADTLVEDYDVVDLLTGLADRCVSLLGISAAGVMLASPAGSLGLVASSSEAMRLLELFELQQQEGPCLDAFRTGERVGHENLEAGAGRWPSFSAAALQAGFQSASALPLRLREVTLGALNLLSVTRAPMDEADVIVAWAFADLATLSIVQHRASAEDQQDPESSRGWQLTRSRTLIEPRGGVIVAEFFDVDKSRSIPWQRRPHATALLAELKNPDRGFDAVVIGEPHRAFYGNQYGLTFPLFEHYGVPLWVPEVGGPIDPGNEAHDLVMSVFGGMSKGERNRIKIRVRTAMETQAKIEGRFLGGRPPYGYQLVDVGPHPNPAKAADGKRAYRLETDPEAAPVVQRIFTWFVGGHGIYAIAEMLTREGIPCPSAHDPGRNRHRCGIAWNKFAVRAILANPRYTGHQVWNRQRKDEVLLDVDDVALGHTTKLRWNETDKWVWSEHIVHPPIINREVFDQVQALLGGRGSAHADHKPHRARRPYALRGCLWCGICERRMQSHWANSAPYYRCRFPAEYALANRIKHPLNVCLREDAIVGDVDRWLTREFAPPRLRQTIADLVAAQDQGPIRPDDHDETAQKIAACDHKLAQYRAALDAGASPVTVAGWIAETEAERTRHEMSLRQSATRAHMNEEEIEAMISRLGGLPSPCMMPIRTTRQRSTSS